MVVVTSTPGDSDTDQKTNDLDVFESSFWESYDAIDRCLNNKTEKVCISYGLCALSTILSVFACLLLTYQRCYLRKNVTVNAATCAMYCFFGNLCHSVGAFLSKQMSFQVLMGALWAALDVISVFAVLLSICISHHSEKGKRMRMLRKRRRQNLLMVVLVMMVGGGIHFTTESHLHTLGETSAHQRRLLSVFTEGKLGHLGYILGLLSFVISWTSRFPTILEAYNRKQRSSVHAVAGSLFAVAGGLYTAAILVYDAKLAFVVKALPWIMSSACLGVLELLILLLSLRRWRSGSHLPLRSVGSDREALIEDTCYGSNHTRKRSRKCKDAFMANNNLPKRSDMGHYMDVTVQPVRKWDFEEAASLQGCKVSVKQQDWAEAFPLEQWTGTPATASSFSTRPAPAPGTPTPCCCELNTATASHMPGEVDGKTEAILEK
ncbi:transmembrane protein 44 isoform X2 [Engraulis encrasicolus]|uniref:transmembrane protein 44 isoform X2 n=1 Tax=Engraulis encrasicolus TaxID=184585 RepID=UPI002FD650D3